MINLLLKLEESYEAYARQMSKAHPDSVLSKERYVRHGFIYSHVFNNEAGVILYQKVSIAGIEVSVPTHFAPSSFKSQKRLVESFVEAADNNVILAVTSQLGRMAKRLGFIKIADVKATFRYEEIDKEILVHRDLLIAIFIGLLSTGSVIEALLILGQMIQEFNNQSYGSYVEPIDIKGSQEKWDLYNSIYGYEDIEEYDFLLSDQELEGEYLEYDPEGYGYEPEEPEIEEEDEWEYYEDYY